MKCLTCSRELKDDEPHDCKLSDCKSEGQILEETFHDLKLSHEVRQEIRDSLSFLVGFS